MISTSITTQGACQKILHHKDWNIESDMEKNNENEMNWNTRK